ncbi:MAG: hypothetical protein NVSMB14_00190 [Isosphaeraceae bacterium]
MSRLQPSKTDSDNDHDAEKGVAVRSSNEQVRTQSRTRGELRRHHDHDHDLDLDILAPAVFPAFFDLYPDPTYQGPTYIFTPPGPAPGNIQLQLYRAALPNGSGPNAFDFYSNGMSQYLYIPYISVPTSPPNSTPTITQTTILTTGIATGGSTPTLDSSPLYYPTYTVRPAPTVFPSLATRINSFQPPPAFANPTIPVEALIYYRSAGQEVVLRLNGIPGLLNPVCYVWRKILVDYVGATCPAGYAAGPEDLFLQCNC